MRPEWDAKNLAQDEVLGMQQTRQSSPGGTADLKWPVSETKSPMPPINLLLITGSMGSGKTTILSEASDILTARSIPHASIDVDALGTAHLQPTVQNNQLMYQNLHSVWENYAHAGLTRLLLARAIEDRAELEQCRNALSGAEIV